MLTTASAAAAAIAAALLIFVLFSRARLRERRYRTLLDNLPQTSVILFDRSLSLRLVVGPSLRKSGLDPDRIEGRRLKEVVPGVQGEILSRHYAAALRGESRSLEYTSVLDGRDYWVRVLPVREGEEIVGGMAISQDISDRKLVEQERDLAESRRQLMIDAMSQAYVAIDSQGRITDWNAGATKTFGYSREEAIDRPATQTIIPPEDHAEFDALIERIARRKRQGQHLDLRTERNALHQDGHTFPVELAAATMEHRGEVFLHAFMHDITERKRAEATTRIHAADVEAISEATGALARSTVRDEARTSICRAAKSIAGAQVAMLFEPDADGAGLRVTAALGSAVGSGLLSFDDSPSGAVQAFKTRAMLFISDLERDRGADESMIHNTGMASALWVPVQLDDNSLGVIAVAWKRPHPELSDRVRQMMGRVAVEAAIAIGRTGLLDRLAWMAMTDDLTGLPNRRAWDQELRRELARARRGGSPLTVAMVDLDYFKAYNDRLGHQAGDRLLREAAEVWQDALRETDMLARYGGEEFAVALPNCDQEAAAGLIERLREETPWGESCSAGLATWDRLESADQLVGRADLALYAAKQAGRNRAVSAGIIERESASSPGLGT